MQTLKESAATTSVELNASHKYVAPAIESVLTPDDLEREVAYAGAGLSAPIG